MTTEEKQILTAALDVAKRLQTDDDPGEYDAALRLIDALLDMLDLAKEEN